MRIATGLLHGTQPLHGRSPSIVLAGITILFLMAALGVVVWIAARQPRPAGGGWWWRRLPEGSPSPWQPIPGLGSSPRPRRGGLRSSVCPTTAVEPARPASRSRITVSH